VTAIPSRNARDNRLLGDSTTATLAALVRWSPDTAAGVALKLAVTLSVSRVRRPPSSAFIRVPAVAPDPIMRERSAASRLRSLRSPPLRP
jgi:hypothetical protein